MAQLVLILCLLSDPGTCKDVSQEVYMSDCLAHAQQLASNYLRTSGDGIKYGLKGWKCQFGARPNTQA
jgi:hypothetical protein